MGLELTGLALEWDDSMPNYYTHGVACVGVDDLAVVDFDGRPAHAEGDDAAIHLRDTSTVSVQNSRARPGMGAFLVAEDTDDERLFAANDLTDAEKMVAGSTAFTVAGNARPWRG